MTTSAPSSPDRTPFDALRSLVDHFDPATSIADDLFVGAFILIFLLAARLTSRLHREAVERRIGRRMQGLCESIVEILAPHGATEAWARWRRAGHSFHLDVVFPRGVAHLDCGVRAELPDIVQAILAVHDACLHEEIDEDMNRDEADAREPTPDPNRWWHVLGVPRSADRTMVRSAYRQKAMETHPDHGGDPEAMASLNAARDAAETEITTHA